MNAPPSDAPDRIIAILEKNRRERIVVSLRSYQGHRFVDVRVQFVGDDGWRPTARGVGIRPDLLDDVIDALGQARERARSEGLLPEPRR